MNAVSHFRLADLIVLLCIILLFGSLVLPAMLCSAGHSREAVCRNNLKFIGVGLDLWKQHADRYPIWDLAGTLTSNPYLAPWPDALAMNYPYTPEILESRRTQLTSMGLPPEYFIKTVDDDKIFMCPSDHPHPHKINAARSAAWGFWRSDAQDGYEYSYAITAYVNSAKYHPRADQQALVPDGLWDFTINLSAAWIANPNASFDSPSWYCNTVGYWHKRNSSNFLLRDLHVENHEYPPDTNKVFYVNPGEDINGFNDGH